MLIATVTFPEALARALVSGEARGDDPRYRAKAALLESWGEAAPRPWDLAAHGGDVLVVNGWVPDADALAPTAASRRLGAVVELTAWEPPTEGGAALMRLTTIAQRDLGNDHGAGRRTFADAAGPLEPGEARDSERRRGLYAAWLAEALSRPRSGLRVASSPEVTRVGRVGTWRKGGGAKRDVPMPAVTAVLDVEVVDRGALEAFVLSGFRKAKDLGFGCLIPYGLGLPGLAR